MKELKIDIEVLQILSRSEANQYRLVPYVADAKTITLYGDSEHDYRETVIELEVITGRKIIVTPIETVELNRLLGQCYREQQANNTLSITAGQGFLMALIEEAFGCYASDIHFEPYEERCRVRLRIDGKLIERYVINRNDYLPLVNQIKIIAGLDISEKRLPQDGRIFYNQAGKRFDVRVSCLPTIHGEKIVLRLLTRHVALLDINNLGLNERQLRDYNDAVSNPHGLILISGPTGSGKSTTLYATLRMLNHESNNILTIEDPVEYTLEGVNQVPLREDIGLTFGSALRTFLRQDPDIIMLGEIRDGDTAQMAIRSALTGHLIFSTIHTNSAWGCVSRLADMGVHPYLISGTLRMCVAQRLVRLLCPDCKQHEGEYFKATGCEKCYYTGYSGRKAIYEVIKIDDELRASIKSGDDSIKEYLLKNDITTLNQSAHNLLQQGLTSEEEIFSLINESS